MVDPLLLVCLLFSAWNDATVRWNMLQDVIVPYRFGLSESLGTLALRTSRRRTDSLTDAKLDQITRWRHKFCNAADFPDSMDKTALSCLR